MSSPKELLSQADLTTSELLISAQGRFLSYEAICEAMNYELSGHVWQILKRQTTPEGVRVSYKALPIAQWEILQSRLDPKDWPLLPQAQKHRRDLHRRRQLELSVMALTSALFVVLLTVGSMAYTSNARYLKGLEVMVEGRTSSQRVLGNPQSQWVASINDLTRRLAGHAYAIEAFEVDAKGGWLKLTAPANASSTPLEAVDSAWPDVNFIEHKGGYQWSW